VLVAGVLLVSAEPWHPAATPIGNGLLLLFAVAALGVALLPLLPLRTSFVRQRSAGAEAPHVVHVAPRYLAVAESSVERRFAWGVVRGVRVGSDLLVIDVPDRRVVIPTRLFEGPHERAAVIERIRGGRQAARVARAERRRRTDPFAPPRRS